MLIYSQGVLEAFLLQLFYNKNSLGEQTMNQNVPTRQESIESLTWDLSSIYPSDQAFEAAFKEVESLLQGMASYEVSLTQSADDLFKALEARNTLLMKIEALYTYAHLRNDQDTSNALYQGLISRAQTLYSQVAAALSFMETSLLKADEALLRTYLKDEKLSLYAHEFDLMFKRRTHILSDKEEKLLASASDILASSSHTFSVLNNADLTFKSLTDAQGQSLPLSHGRYGVYLESKDRNLRQQAFESMYASYQQFANTFAMTLSQSVKLHNFNASLRGFSSAREAALFANHIPESVYDALVEAVHDQLPLLHRYVTLRKKALKIDDLRMYDLYVPIVSDLDLEYTYENAQNILLEAFSVLGEDYVSGIRKAFNERWIDVMENKGKRSGAYSSGCYTSNPYILMNWQDNLDNLYTLAHELGHSMHSYYSRKHQAYIYGDYSIFVAEVASTTNENLLTAYLLNKTTDLQVRAYLLNHYLDGVKGTVYRQTQFAEFEHMIHVLDQKGEALTAESLNQKYFELNQTYYGPEMIYDEAIHYEWARIPHFYYNYYVYQYATGFSAASALSAKILNEGQSAVKAYLSFLKTGSSLTPIDALKVAGVDMSNNQAVKDALELFKQRLEELDSLIA